MNKRNKIDEYLQEPEREVPADQYAGLNEADREALAMEKSMDQSLRSTFNALSENTPAPLYSEDEFSKMLLNRLEAEGLPGSSKDPLGAGILESLKGFLSPGIPLYAGGGLAAAAAVVLAILFYNPSSEISQTALEESAKESAAEASEEASDGPRMMADAEDPAKESREEAQNSEREQVAVATPPGRERQVPAQNPEASDQESEESEDPTKPAQGDAGNQEIASNMPEAETTPPVEGTEELSEEVRRGFMNDRYAAAYNKEMRLKRAVKNAASPEEKHQALEDLLDYYEGKGEESKAQDVKNQIAELK